MTHSDRLRRRFTQSAERLPASLGAHRPDEFGRRLNAGTVLIREYEGQRHTVTVVPDGFQWQGETYSSLSTIARAITGANWSGMTLYVFDKDSVGKSACNGLCVGNWPPLMATATSMPMGDYTIITRDDGTKQWAYKGRPLDAWKNDKSPGDITGDGFLNGAWHAAQP
jgi:predicted lipoprotein with Yx(FWY)xxD motif